MQVARYNDPQEAAISLVVESYRLWLTYETRTDDISAIVIMLETVDQNQPGYTASASIRFYPTDVLCWSFHGCTVLTLSVEASILYLLYTVSV